MTTRVFLDESRRRAHGPLLARTRSRASPRIFPQRRRCSHPPTNHAAATAMINAVLVFNNAGQSRLTKFYTQLVCAGFPTTTATTTTTTTTTKQTQETSVQQRLISEIFTLVANRPNSACNFLPYAVPRPASVALLPTNHAAAFRLSSPAAPNPRRPRRRTMTLPLS